MRESVQSPLCELTSSALRVTSSRRNLLARYLAQVQTAPGDWHLRDQPRRVAGPRLLADIHQARIAPIQCQRVASQFTICRLVIRTPSLPERTLIESNNEVCDAKLIASLSARPVRQ